jgi:cholesterol transport system auxiliary component
MSISIPKNRSATLFCRRSAAALSFMALGACGILQPAEAPNSSVYSLERMPGKAPLTAPMSAPTLIVSPPHAAAGYDSKRIIYVREPHRLDYFAHSDWVEPPARMLAPLLVAAVENSGAFGAVVLMPSTAVGDLRLDSEIIRLHQDFRTQPSRVRFTLRAQLIDENTRRVLGWREFDVSVAAASENPYGGVVAASQAVHEVLASLSAFCAEIAQGIPIKH